MAEAIDIELTQPNPNGQKPWVLSSTPTLVYKVSSVLNSFLVFPIAIVQSPQYIDLFNQRTPFDTKSYSV